LFDHKKKFFNHGIHARLLAGKINSTIAYQMARDAAAMPEYVCVFRG
jgi:hypothetical protein